MLVLWILALVCVAGIVGGLIDAVARLATLGKDGAEYKAASGVPLDLYLLARCLTGMGGSLAVLLALIVANRLPDLTHVPVDYLFLISVSLVAGFAGQRILPAVATRLEEQIEKSVQKRSEEAKEEVKREVKQDVEKLGEAQEHLTLMTKSYRAVTTAMVDLNKGAQATEIENDKAQLESLRRQLPRDRTLHIVLGRLHKRLGEYDQAIQVLSDFIKTNEADGNPSDVAAALYNRACYNSVKSASDKNPAPLREKALEDLARSLKLWVDGKKLAPGDDDFNSLKQDPAFKDHFETLVKP
ncbi:MAG: hypothetical protein LAP13_26480 [Acidobacteriia bacterium]|nr:hypothetical protein [Terriglobia bacterium]